MSDIDERLELLRQPFSSEVVGRLPRVTCKACSEKKCSEHTRRKCDVCGAFMSPAHIHLDYVGHAPVTDRLLSADPEWTWEPVAWDEKGMPLLIRNNNGYPTGMWIRLTVLGITRLGYGSIEIPKAEPIAVKELIGDAIRNAAMRFGVALSLWSKNDLESDIIDSSEPADEDEGDKPDAKANGRVAIAKARAAVKRAKPAEPPLPSEVPLRKPAPSPVHIAGSPICGLCNEAIAPDQPARKVKGVISHKECPDPGRPFTDRPPATQDATDPSPGSVAPADTGRHRPPPADAPVLHGSGTSEAESEGGAGTVTPAPPSPSPAPTDTARGKGDEDASHDHAEANAGPGGQAPASPRRRSAASALHAAAAKKLPGPHQEGILDCVCLVVSGDRTTSAGELSGHELAQARGWVTDLAEGQSAQVFADSDAIELCEGTTSHLFALVDGGTWVRVEDEG
ncbi:MAG: hypothetical protein LC750_07645 [Actinobacteria bacterium]|nr:hypothetical protein [Actinomycetota bacterium]